MGKILDENGIPKRGYPTKVLEEGVNLFPVSVSQLLEEGGLSERDRIFFMSEEGQKTEVLRYIPNNSTSSNVG